MEINAGTFVDDVLDRAFESFRSIIPYDRMGCALLNDDNKIATSIWMKTNVSITSLKVGYAAAMAKSSLQQVINTREPRILNDLESYLAGHPKSTSTKLILEEGMRSSLTCPLIVAGGKPVGFLFFSSTEKNTYRDIHQDIFLQIAGQISIMVEKSRLYQQLYDLNQKLLLATHELQHKATHDTLTEMYNHGAITEHLATQLARAKRQKQSICIVMADVDHFKKVNDAHGHLAGDVVLKKVAAKMKECLREYDYIGRYGGEEFLIVLGDTDYETAVKAAKRLIKAVEVATVAVGDKELVVTISAGVAVAVDCTEIDTDKIISVADKELYKAKANGRNRVEACQV